MEQSEAARRAIEAVRAVCEEPSVKPEPDPNRKEVWPPETKDAFHRFHGQPHAKLFPFIGRKVRTPQGPGTLLQVFAERTTVLLDSQREGACVRFLPGEITPVAVEDVYS